MFKKLINIAVVVITCFTVLFASTFSVYAAEPDDVAYVMSNGDVYHLDDNKEIYDFIYPYFSQSSPIATFNAASAVGALEQYGFDWATISEEFASMGIGFATGGAYMLACLFAGGMLVYGVNGLVETIIEDGPYAFECLVNLTYHYLGSGSQEELGKAFDGYMTTGSFSISQALSDEICAVLEGYITADSAGNVVDTSILIADSLIGGVFEETYVERGFLELSQVMFEVKNYTLNTWATYQNNFLTLGFYNDSPISGGSISAYWQNNLTGSAMLFSTTSPNHYRFYKPFQVFAEDGSVFWVFYTGTTSNRLGYVWSPYSVTADNPISFQNTGTVLDGKTFVEIMYDTATDLWGYINAGGQVTWFPLDPYGTILSNTGTGTTTGGGAIAIPAAPTNTPGIPWWMPPVIPWGGTSTGTGTTTGTGTGAIPITNDISISTATDTDTDIDTDLAPDLTTPDKITDFLTGIVDFFKGLFDWLPVNFTNALDGVIVSLSAFIVLMAAVKIVDILWP